VKQLPAHLKPKYAARVVEAVYAQAVKEIMSRRVLDDFMLDSEDVFV
jgi:hypothetical protein